MAITDGSILTAADLNLLPRSFASTAARDAYYTANPSLLVAGVKAVIGSGATYSEYIYDGTAWRLWVSPWVAISPAAGFAASGNPGVQIVGGLSTLRGALTGTVAATTNTQIGTVPAGYRPGYANQAASAASDDQTGVPMTCWIETSGAIWIRKQTATGTCTLSLGALGGYSID